MTRSQMVEGLSHTVDLDIENCSFTLLHQIIQRVNPQSLPAADAELLRRCAHSREGLCKEMGVGTSWGKSLLMAVLNGKQVRDTDPGCGVLRQVTRLGRLLRWMSWEVLADLHRQLSSDRTRQCPDIGMLFHLWSAVEDLVLEEWIKYIRTTVETTHLSLHFDGVRIELPETMDVSSFCTECALHIHGTTNNWIFCHHQTKGT